MVLDCIDSCISPSSLRAFICNHLVDEERERERERDRETETESVV